MSTNGVSGETFSRAIDALSTARDNQVARSQQAFEAAGQSIQARTGMPPLTEFFSYQAEQIAAQSQRAGSSGSSQPSFIQQLVQDIRALKTPQPIAQPPAAEHIDVVA